MPRRWEQELHRLNDIDAPDERLRERAAAPPRAGGGFDHAPSTGQRIVAGALAFGVFLAAGAFGWRALRPDTPADPPPVTLAADGSLVVRIEPPRPGEEDLFQGDTGASATLTVGPVGLRGLLVTFNWCGDAGPPCQGGTLDYDVTEFLPVEPGAAVLVESDALDVRGHFHEWGKDDPPWPMRAGTPSEPGEYELLVDVKYPGGTMQFSFGVEVVRSDPPGPSGDASDELRIRCDVDSTTVVSPVVKAQADGVHVVVVPRGGSHQITFREQGGGRATFGGRIEADGHAHPWWIPPGRTHVVCGSGFGGAPDAARFEVVDPDGHWAWGELLCDEASRAEIVGYDGGAAEWVDEDAMIRGILRGVRESDRIVPAHYGRDRLRRWAIVRDGVEIGVVFVTAVTDETDPRGSGLGRVDGEVCASSGVVGNVPPRDPDEDGVTLDCMTTNQIAFRHRGGVLEPSGEAFLRVNVSGIRSTDELVPPEDGSGEDGFDGTWRVEREGKTVASIEYPSLDGITCRWNAIGTDPSDP